MNLGDALAGRVRLRPGAALPTVHNERPLLARRLARGRGADELPDRLGALFTLCSHAHRSTARRAVAAARGELAVSTREQRIALQAASAREQLLRIAHDWPRLLAGAMPMATALAGCPALRGDLSPASRLQELPDWLARHWLGGPLEDWLRRHAADAENWTSAWCEYADTPLARLLLGQRDALQRLATPSRPLNLLAQPLATLPPLARRLAQEADFCARPDWLGAPAETGPWTRIKDPVPLPLHNAWMRLLARFVDLLRLAAPEGVDWLAEGALPLPGGEGIAWTEMARGLLVHWVRLEGDRVDDCQVLAPTEWNFHPQGLLARTLAGLHGADRAEQAARAAVAFDPCVEFVIETLEPAHA